MGNNLHALSKIRHLCLGVALTLSFSSCRLLVEVPKDLKPFKKQKAFITINKAKSINLLVWNIHKQKGNDFYKDIEVLSKVSDIFLFQEGYLNLKFKKFFFKQKWEHLFAKSFIYKMENIPTGVYTASKFQINQTIQLRSKSIEPVSATPKTALISMVENLMLINIHGLNFVSLSQWINQLEDIAKFISSHNGPIIFAGDFNTWSKKRMNFLLLFCQKHKLKKLEIKNQSSYSFLNYSLDHILTRGIKVISAEALNEINSSDHKPLLLKFKFN